MSGIYDFVFLSMYRLYFFIIFVYFYNLQNIRTKKCELSKQISEYQFKNIYKICENHICAHFNVDYKSNKIELRYRFYDVCNSHPQARVGGRVVGWVMLLWVTRVIPHSIRQVELLCNQSFGDRLSYPEDRGSRLRNRPMLRSFWKL